MENIIDNLDELIENTNKNGLASLIKIIKENDIDEARIKNLFICILTKLTTHNYKYDIESLTKNAIKLVSPGLKKEVDFNLKNLYKKK
jgi:hypothetical protein